jgi:Domain of unknown function (DUF4160)
MPELKRFSNCKICMYADDHFPPHFHIRGPGWEVSVDLQSLVITVGKGASGDISEARHWARENQATLFAEWAKLNERD